ncbi:MAG: extracellular solute-binding protein [Chloroflexales bacterium]|nr:extracellular solute-binding protein [Chloroflexales bacterium]
MDEHVSRKLTRRQLLSLGGKTALTAAVLTACGAQQNQAPATNGDTAPDSDGAGGAPALAPATISLMTFGQADQPAFDATVARFMEIQDTVKVETTFAPNDETYYTKIQTQIAGGAQPDIASMQGWGFQPFADTDTIAKMEEWQQRDDFYAAWADAQVVKDYTERNGSVWLMPMQLATMVMFYSKKLFDEAGLPYPTDDWTFEEFVEIAQQLTKTTDGRKQFGYQANGNWFRDIHWIRGTGKQEFDTLIEPKQSTFNQPEIVEIVQMIAADFYYKMNIAPTPADLDSGAGGIEAGASAMKYEGPWWMPRMSTPELREEGKDLPFDVVLMPAQQDGSRPHRSWAEGVTILKTGNEAAAWECCKFMGGEEGQKIFSEVSGRIPNSIALIESFWGPIAKEQFGLENYKAFATAFTSGEVDVISGINRAQFWNEVVKPSGWDPMLAGSASAAEVLPKVDEALQEMLDEYWADRG